MGDLSSESAPLLASGHARGTYAPAGPDDERSPCPLINSLANHGYINRNGKHIHASQLNAAMNEVGLSRALGTVFARPIFNEHQDPKTARLQKKKSLLARLWAFIRNPWVVLAAFGMRRPNQIDSKGKAFLNLEQLAQPGIVEHDISLCRRDHKQPQGNCALQPDLVKALLASSSDGKTLTMEDLTTFRKHRMQQQLEDNPGLKYGPNEHGVGCTEIALVLALLGNRKSIPYSYAKAFFQEQRLPVKEGWRKRWLWTLGFLELGRIQNKVKDMIGLRL